ncbi:MFS transporter [Rhodanobacter sp. BL-MT-08]
MTLQAARSPWRIVLGAVLGLVVGNGPIMQFSFGVFIKPVSAELGVQRGTLSTALMIGLVLTGLATPFVGRYVDRHGIRRIALSAIVLFAIGMAMIGQVTTSLMTFIMLYALTGLVAAGQTPLIYAKAVSAAFDRRRGLALGVAMAGVGVGTALVPRLAQYLIDHVGWRHAYLGLGALTAVVAIPAIIWLVDGGAYEKGVPPELPGLTAKEVVRTGTFWKLVLAFFALATAASGTIAHLVPLMTDRGIPAATAANVLATAGLALIAGRLLAGYLLDRFFAPYIAATFFAMPIIGILMLLSTNSVAMAIPSIMLVGLGLGAEVDFIAYLQSRYFGLRAFGEVYGYFFAVFMFGSGVGPFLVGMGFQKLHNYEVPLYVICGGLLIACLLMLILGPYRYGQNQALGGQGDRASPLLETKPAH